MKFIHKVRYHKTKAKFDFGLCYFFRSGVMLLLILVRSRSICVLWTHCSFFFRLAYIFVLCQWHKWCNFPVKTQNIRFFQNDRIISVLIFFSHMKLCAVCFLMKVSFELEWNRKFYWYKGIGFLNEICKFVETNWL
jgi:hypothetical protein